MSALTQKIIWPQIFTAKSSLAAVSEDELLQLSYITPYVSKSNAWLHAAEIGSCLLTSEQKSFTANLIQLALDQAGHWAK